MIDLFYRVAQISEEKFPDATAVHSLLKLKQEADEAIEHPKDISEYADCLIALLSAVWKAGKPFSDLLEAAKRKADILELREWERQPDGTYQHIKNIN